MESEPWRRGIEATVEAASRLRRGCVEAAVEAVRRGIEPYSRLTPPVVSVKASRVRRGYTSRHTLGIRRGYIDMSRLYVEAIVAIRRGYPHTVYVEAIV